MSDIGTTISYKEGSFGALVVSMLRHQSHEAVVQVAEAYCAACGGLPDDCAHVADFVESTCWDQSPTAVVVIPELIAQANHA